MKKYVLGIDIGGTKSAVILGKAQQFSPDRKDGLIIDKIRFETEKGKGCQPVLVKIFDSIDALLERHGIGQKEVAAIGISCGGPLDSHKGIILNPPNLVEWEKVPIVYHMEQRYGIKTYLQNDANACALAEWKFGAARGYRNVIFLTFGTGMGAGLILNGRLYTGSNDMAGEVGHIRITDFGPVGYGKAGSFEGFCSGGGIAQIAGMKVLERLQTGEAPGFCPNMESLSRLDAKTVADAAKQGEPLAQEIYNICGHFLGMGISLLLDLLNPEIIVLGSIFERCENLLRKPMEEVIRQEALMLTRENVRIVPAQCGDDIGDYGALSVALMGISEGIPGGKEE